MKKLFLFLAALFLAVAAESQVQSDWIAQIHFLGAGKIAADTNSLAFTNEFCSAEARTLESQTLDRLSRAPGIWFKSKLPAGAGDGSAQLRPLLDDLLKSEWTFEMRDTPDGSPEYALAIHLSNERAQIWSKNLQTLLQNWTDLGVSQNKSGVWSLQKHQPPNLFQFAHLGDFAVLDCGENKLELQNEISRQLANVSVAETNWLSADLNWPRLAQLFPSLIKINLPKTELQVAGRDGNLQLNGKITLSQPLSPLDAWQFPTNTIHQPFVSFTAARGLASWLERQNWAQPYDISPAPNQVFIWALAGVPFQTFVAAPVPNATAALSQLGQKLSANTGWKNHFLSPFTLTETNDQIFWGGVPFISPSVTALHEKSGDLLLAGFFPNSPRSKPLPPELFTQLATPNLVFYHWEITAERLPEIQNLVQLGFVLTRHQQLDPKSAAGKWLAHVGPTLGNTVTKITQTAPEELAFSRKAPGGLTAMELFGLASWLEAANFPGCDLRLPPPHFQNRKAAAPLPAMPGIPR
jgi:hypothetical protein